MFVSIAGVSKSYGGVPAVRDCSLDLAKGEFVTLLGPSGCGKTTLLRAIAGFVRPDCGSITIDRHDIAQLPPNRREVGLVFQSYALFPHLDVARNVGYGLAVRGISRTERQRRVGAALELVGLGGLADRWPRELSGGQQQRVALARVLILEPRVLLLDEPFGALDAKLRLSMQVDVKQLVLRLGMTTLFVTHDQDEALAMSDRIAVMRGGAIEQVGTPLEIYDRPVNAFVADFIGTSNLFDGVAVDGTVALGGGAPLSTPLSGPVSVAIRPENLEIRPAGEGAMAGHVRFVKHLGATTMYRVAVDGRDLSVFTIREPGAATLAIGAAVGVAIRDPAQCRFLPRSAD